MELVSSRIVDYHLFLIVHIDDLIGQLDSITFISVKGSTRKHPPNFTDRYYNLHSKLNKCEK